MRQLSWRLKCGLVECVWIPFECIPSVVLFLSLFINNALNVLRPNGALIGFSRHAAFLGR